MYGKATSWSNISAIFLKKLLPGGFLVLLAGLGGLVVLLFVQPVVQAAVPGGTGSDGNWVWQNPVPQGNDLLSVSCPSSATCYAVGTNGTILAGNETTWQVATPTLSEKFLNAITCTSATKCYAVGDNGTIITYNGTNWALTPPSPTTIYNFNAISCPDPDFCLAVAQTGRVATYTLATGWQTGSHGHSDSYTGLSCPTVSFCLAVTNNGKVYSWNNTNAWQQVYSLNGKTFYSISCWDVTNCFISGNLGTLVRYNGSFSDVSFANVTENLNEVSCKNFNSNPFCYLVGDSGLSYRFENSTWQTISPPTASSEDLQSVVCLSTTDCTIVGEAGHISKYNGTAVTLLTIAKTREQINGASCSGQSCLAVGANGTILRYNASNWETMAAPLTTTLNSVSCFAANSCVAVGNAGATLHYDGSSWISKTSGTTNILTGVSCPAQNLCLAVGAGPVTLLKYDGVSWSTLTAPSGFSSTARGISCPTITFCAAATDNSNSILVYNNGVWSTSSLNGTNFSSFQAVSCPSASFCLAAGSSAGYAIFSNGSWTKNQINGAFSSFRGVGCVSATECYLVGDYGSYAVYNGAVSTEARFTNSNRALRVVSCQNSGVCITGGEGGFILARNLTGAIGNPVPTLSLLSVQEMDKDAASFTLTLSGTNFITGSVVRWENADLPTTYVNSVNLTTTVPANYLTTAGSYNLRIFNPAPGGGLSNSLAFTVCNPFLVNKSTADSSCGSFSHALAAAALNPNSVINLNIPGANPTITFSQALTLPVGTTLQTSGGQNACAAPVTLAGNGQTFTLAGNNTLTALHLLGLAVKAASTNNHFSCVIAHQTAF